MSQGCNEAGGRAEMAVSQWLSAGQEPELQVEDCEAEVWETLLVHGRRETARDGCHGHCEG